MVAGDAAHIHPPHGGQGLNLDLQDAVNLGRTLAGVVRGQSPHELLDTHHAERHPVGARVVHNTMAQVAITSGGARHQVLRDVLPDPISMDEPRQHLAVMLCGLDISYDLEDGRSLHGLDSSCSTHPLVGRRMPDIDLRTVDGGPFRMFELLHDARGVLVNFGEPGSVHMSAYADRVRLVDVDHPDPLVLPVLGAVAPTAAVRVRPDGHVPWAGDPGLSQALTRWFGRPRRAAEEEIR